MIDLLRPLSDEEVRIFLGRRRGYRVRLKDLPLRERLLRGVDTTDPRRCWLWQRGKRGSDYGAVAFHGRDIAAHRASYEVFHGPIPEGRYVCHDCPDGHNKLCINPLHLYAGTAAHNGRDVAYRGPQARVIVDGWRLDDDDRPGWYCLLRDRDRHTQRPIPEVRHERASVTPAPDRWSRLRAEADYLLSLAGTTF